MEQSDILSLSDLRDRYRELFGTVVRSAEAVSRAVEIISTITGVQGSDILSRSRHKRRTLPRNLLYWTLHDVLGFTQEEIASLMQRDHSTVCHGIAEVAKTAAKSPAMADFIWQAKQRIRKELTDAPD